MTIKKVFIVGAGTMGNGIAQTAAVSGYEVMMMEYIGMFYSKKFQIGRQAAGEGAHQPGTA